MIEGPEKEDELLILKAMKDGVDFNVITSVFSPFRYVIEVCGLIVMFFFL
jgi:hypothetical protein